MHLRYYSHLGQDTGFGRAALEYALALHRHTDVQLDLRLMKNLELTGRANELVPLVNRGGTPDVVLVHTLPRDCNRVLDLEQIDPAIPAVAYTTWETQSYPAQNAPIIWARFAKILTPSHVSADAFSAAGLDEVRMGQRCADRIRVVPHCFDALELAMHRGRGVALSDDRPRDEPFTFYYVGAANRRKNIGGLIAAFAYAFADARPGAVRLHLHCPGDQVHVASAIAATGLETKLPITCHRQHLPEDRLWAMHALGDVFATASHGEAWNLGAFEAALMGRHVIAPAGQGSDEYLLGTSADLYASSWAPALHDTQAEIVGGGVKITTSGPPGLTAQQIWQEPDLMALAKAMMMAYGKKTRTLTCDDLAARFEHQVVARQLVQELETAAHVR